MHLPDRHPATNTRHVSRRIDPIQVAVWVTALTACVGVWVGVAVAVSHLI